MLARYRAELRSMGLDKMFSTSMWFILTMMVSTFMLWTAAYWLRIYLHYDALELAYSDANETIYMARHRITGSKYRARHPDEVTKSKELLKMGRFKRAVIETWQHSYLCGATSCLELVTGGLDIKMLVLYLLAIGFGVSLIGQGVVNIMFALSRVTHFVGTHQKDPDQDIQPVHQKST